MLAWFRHVRSSIATALLVAMALLGAASVKPHGDDCHDACAPFVVAHDPSAHRFQAAPDTDDPHALHCLVCHWVRAFRPYVQISVAAAIPAACDAAVNSDSSLAVRTACAAQPPLRSPPSALDRLS